MKFSELQKKYQHFYAPNFRIKVKGKDILKEKVEVFSVTVNNTLEGADDFSFVTSNPFDLGSGEFTYLKEGSLFEVNNEVEISVGYGDNKNLKTILQGLITGVDVSFPSNGVSQLTVKGFDFSHKMMKEKRSENYGSSDQPVTYSEIVRKIIREQGYKLETGKIVDTRERHRQIKQDRESDWDFIKNKLANAINFELFVFGKDLYFRPPASDKSEVITTLKWGQTLFSFAPEVNAASQVREVEVRGWDPAAQQPIIGRGRPADLHGRDRSGSSGAEEAEQGVVHHVWQPVSSQKEADDLARSILNKISEGFVKGNGECIGIPDILPGNNIELAGLGKRFSKVYYIEKATHSISASGYKTTFSVKENMI